jgi:hypothetical protein
MVAKLLSSVLCVTVTIYAIAVCADTNNTKEFFSWYDGWGVHTVWGLGKVSSPYIGASVECGNAEVKVTPIYDSHSNEGPPKYEQSSEFAKAHNIDLSSLLKSKGVKCSFLPE